MNILVMNRHIKENYMFTSCSLWLFGKIRIDMLLIELQCLTYKNNLQFMGAQKLALWVWKTWSHFLIHYIQVFDIPPPFKKILRRFSTNVVLYLAFGILLNTLTSPLKGSSLACLRVSASRFNILSFLKLVRLPKRKSGKMSSDYIKNLC